MTMRYKVAYYRRPRCPRDIGIRSRLQIVTVPYPYLLRMLYSREIHVVAAVSVVVRPPAPPVKGVIEHD